MRGSYLYSTFGDTNAHGVFLYTSALDTSTEKDIQKALQNLVKGRSSLSIAHRLSVSAWYLSCQVSLCLTELASIL